MSSDGRPAEGGEPAASVDDATPSVASRRLHAAGIAVLAVRSLRELGLTLRSGTRGHDRARWRSADPAGGRVRGDRRDPGDDRRRCPMGHNPVVGRRRQDPPAHRSDLREGDRRTAVSRPGDRHGARAVAAAVRRARCPRADRRRLPRGRDRAAGRQPGRRRAAPHRAVGGRARPRRTWCHRSPSVSSGAGGC